MLNYYELMNIISTDDHYAIYQINNSFSDDIAAAIKSLKFTDKTRAEAFKKYSAAPDFRKDDKDAGIFGTCTNFIVSGEFKAETPYIGKYMEPGLAFINNKRPVDVDLQGAAAIAKCLGYRAGNDNYYIGIEGNYYSWTLVNTIYQIVANYKKGMDFTECFLSNGGEKEGDYKYSLGNRNALIIRGEKSTGFILPICFKPNGFNVSFEYYMQFRKDLENREIAAAKGGA